MFFLKNKRARIIRSSGTFTSPLVFSINSNESIRCWSQKNSAIGVLRAVSKRPTETERELGIIGNQVVCPCGLGHPTGIVFILNSDALHPSSHSVVARFRESHRHGTNSYVNDYAQHDGAAPRACTLSPKVNWTWRLQKLWHATVLQSPKGSETASASLCFTLREPMIVQKSINLHQRERPALRFGSTRMLSISKYTYPRWHWSIGQSPHQGSNTQTRKRSSPGQDDCTLKDASNLQSAWP